MKEAHRSNVSKTTNFPSRKLMHTRPSRAGELIPEGVQWPWPLAEDAHRPDDRALDHNSKPSAGRGDILKAHPPPPPLLLLFFFVGAAEDV